MTINSDDSDILSDMAQNAAEADASEAARQATDELENARLAAEKQAADEEELDRLAALPLMEYDREREKAAKKLGVRVGTLDDLVAAKRPKKADDAQGHDIELIEPKPWPDEVDGSGLLDAIEIEIRKYIVIDEAPLRAVALWVVASYAFQSFFIFPRLRVKSPTKRCGKTTLLDVLEPLANKTFVTSNLTGPPLFRVIERYGPTIMLDETDGDWFRENNDMRSVINAGHKANGQVVRCVGDAFEVRAFSVFAPIVIAGIGEQHDTVEDRSVVAAVRRKRKDEKTARFRPTRAQGLKVLAQKCARWVGDHVVTLGKADPAMPDGIFNREADNWLPLLAVADAAGGEWPRKARLAALTLSGVLATSDDIKTELLRDIRKVFDEEFKTQDQDEHLLTKELLAKLVGDDSRPWATWSRGRPMTAHSLSRMLSPYGIIAHEFKSPVRGQGYSRILFEQASEPYLVATSVQSPEFPTSKLGSSANPTAAGTSRVFQSSAGTSEPSFEEVEETAVAVRQAELPSFEDRFFPTWDEGGHPFRPDGGSQGSREQTQAKPAAAAGAPIMPSSAEPSVPSRVEVKAPQPKAESLQDRVKLSHPAKPSSGSGNGAPADSPNTHHSRAGGICIHCADCDGKVVPCRHPKARGFYIHHECFRVWLRDGCQPHPTLRALWEARDPARISPETKAAPKTVQGLPPAAGTGTLG
jgi:Protein of unknown function (DUF3631)